MSRILKSPTLLGLPLFLCSFTYQPEHTAKITEPELEHGPNNLTNPGQSLVSLTPSSPGHTSQGQFAHRLSER